MDTITHAFKARSIAMKKFITIPAIVTFLSALAVGCGSAQDAATNSADASNSLALTPRNGPITCSIQTINGHFLTAVGGGGRTTDVIHTDATRALAWEKFVLEDLGEGDGSYGFRTKTGNYLTAVSGGGRITDVIHSNATQINAWERLRINALGGGWFSIQTVNGHYLTANGGGGLISDTIHSDATQVQAWEKFKFFCVSGG
jgi:hypothetical protein